MSNPITQAFDDVDSALGDFDAAAETMQHNITTTRAAIASAREALKKVKTVLFGEEPPADTEGAPSA